MPLTQEQLDAIIEDAISEPQFAQSDSGAVRKHSIPDLLEARRALAADECANAAPARRLQVASLRTTSKGYE